MSDTEVSAMVEAHEGGAAAADGPVASGILPLRVHPSLRQAYLNVIEDVVAKVRRATCLAKNVAVFCQSGSP